MWRPKKLFLWKKQDIFHSSSPFIIQAAHHTHLRTWICYDKLANCNRSSKGSLNILSIACFRENNSIYALRNCNNLLVQPPVKQKKKKTKKRYARKGRIPANIFSSLWSNFPFWSCWQLPRVQVLW